MISSSGAPEHARSLPWERGSGKVFQGCLLQDCLFRACPLQACLPWACLLQGCLLQAFLLQACLRRAGPAFFEFSFDFLRTCSKKPASQRQKRRTKQFRTTTQAVARSNAVLRSAVQDPPSSNFLRFVFEFVQRARPSQVLWTTGLDRGWEAPPNPGGLGSGNLP